MSIVASILLKLVESYIANAATKEVADLVLFKILRAIVKSTKNEYDDEWLKVVDAAVHAKALPEDNQ